MRNRSLLATSLLMLATTIGVFAQGEADTTIVIRGAGGRVISGGLTTYCPQPDPNVCAVIHNVGVGPDTVTVYGSGGLRYQPNGSVVLCPDPGLMPCGRVVTGANGDTTTIYGSGGTIVYPTFTFYCLQVAATVCAVIVNNTVGTDVVNMYGGGGVRVQGANDANPGATWYCPDPATTLCARVRISSTGADTFEIYGSGGTRVAPDGGTMYCMMPGAVLCATVVDNPVGPDQIVLRGSGGYPVDEDYIYCPNPSQAVCAIFWTNYTGGLEDDGIMTRDDRTLVTLYDEKGRETGTRWESNLKLPANSGLPGSHVLYDLEGNVLRLESNPPATTEPGERNTLK